MATQNPQNIPAPQAGTGLIQNPGQQAQDPNAAIDAMDSLEVDTQAIARQQIAGDPGQVDPAQAPQSLPVQRPPGDPQNTPGQPAQPEEVQLTPEQIVARYE